MAFYRNSLLFIFFLFSHLFCASQTDNFNRRDSIRILNSRYHYLDLRMDKKQKQKTLPVSRIEFFDMRYDTTFIALNWSSGFSTIGKTRKDKYNLSGGLASHLAKYYEYQYRQDTSDTGRVLLCFIKQFSILPKQDVLENYMQNPSLLNKPYNYIHTDIECFYKQGDFLYPALQLDTTYNAHFLSGQTKLTDVVEDMLQPFENKLEAMDTTSILKRKHYSKNVAWSNYTQRFKVPLLTSDHYKKGIYKTFAELRTQTPSIDSFHATLNKKNIRATAMQDYDLGSILMRAIQKRNTNVFLYNASDELIEPSKIFAYCPDGETIWIQHGASYYPLVKTGNSFEFLYIYHIPDTTNGINTTSTITLLMPLNMETGASN